MVEFNVGRQPFRPRGQPAENTIAAIARLLGVSRSTIYKYVPELSDSRPGLTDAEIAALPGGTRPLPDVAQYDQLLPSRRAPLGDQP